jgi:membrane-associated phospholipid phosphatase
LRISTAIACVLIVVQAEVRAQDSARVHTSGRKLVNALVAPAAFIAAGLAVDNNHFFLSRRDVLNARNRDFPNFHTTADNYLQYAPALAVYGLVLGGVKGQNNLANQTAILIKTELLLSVITVSLKNTTHVRRPDGSNDQSFPSGHTTQAFAAATFLHREYGYVSVWYSIGGYTVATAVGALRILNNKHWLSDVLAGAGFGILSANLVYLTHQYRWGKKNGHAMIMPTYERGPGMYLSYRFN